MNLRVAAHAPACGSHLGRVMHSSLRVSDLMTTALVTIKPDDNVVSARAEMEVGVFRHLPVVDERHHLVGVLSDRDVIHLKGTNKHVAAVMTRDVMTVKPDSYAHEA